MIRLENFLKISLQDVLKTSSKPLEGVFQDVLKAFWRRLGKMSWRRPDDVLKTPWRRLEDVWPRRIYWSWPRRLEDVRLRRTYSSWSRRLEGVFKASSEDEDKRRLQDVFKTPSSRRMFAGKICKTGYGGQCKRKVIINKINSLYLQWKGLQKIFFLDSKINVKKNFRITSRVIHWIGCESLAFMIY